MVFHVFLFLFFLVRALIIILSHRRAWFFFMMVRIFIWTFFVIISSLRGTLWRNYLACYRTIDIKVGLLTWLRHINMINGDSLLIFSITGKALFHISLFNRHPKVFVSFIIFLPASVVTNLKYIVILYLHFQWLLKVIIKSSFDLLSINQYLILFSNNNLGNF